jgi:hypothetical protein
MTSNILSRTIVRILFACSGETAAWRQPAADKKMAAPRDGPAKLSSDFEVASANERLSGANDACVHLRTVARRAQISRHHARNHTGIFSAESKAR